MTSLYKGQRPLTISDFDLGSKGQKMLRYSFKTLAEATLAPRNCLGCDTNQEFGGGEKEEKKIITYSSPKSPFSRSNTSTPLLPSFHPPAFPSAPVPRPWACSYFIGISSQSAVLIVHLCRSEGSRAQYGTSNYLCPLWCSRATERLTDPRWCRGGVCVWGGLLWHQG